MPRPANRFFLQVYTRSFNEILIFNGQRYKKRYKVTKMGCLALDKPWLSHDELPEELTEPLQQRDVCEVSRILNAYTRKEPGEI